MGGNPIFIRRGEGPYIWDVDGNRYIDFVASWGPLILGHRHLAIEQAVQEALALGTTFGAPTEAEIDLARLIVDAFSSIELIRFVNSGTEATMTALRLARAYTGRDKILKFDGCYHGHSDALLIKAGSGALTLGVPTSQGIPNGLLDSTVTVPFNNLSELEKVFAELGEQLAAVIVEPVPANMGVVLPKPEFLQRIKSLADRYGTVLIWDEVITGFRLSYGGAQQLFGIKPDLTCLGKIIGGGLPVGGVGGKCKIMELLAPLGPVYQAGTLSGNPLAMAAGIAMLKELQHPDFYLQLETKSAFLEKNLRQAIESCRLNNQISITRMGSMLSCFFTGSAVVDYESVRSSDLIQFGKFFWSMLNQGIYIAPSQFEALFVSQAHEEEHLTIAANAAANAFRLATTGER